MLANWILTRKVRSDERLIDDRDLFRCARIAESEVATAKDVRADGLQVAGRNRVPNRHWCVLGRFRFGPPDDAECAAIANLEERQRGGNAGGGNVRVLFEAREEAVEKPTFSARLA